MRQPIKQRILQNNGKIIAENDKRLKTEFSCRQMEKAVKVSFELTKHLKQDTVLRGGCIFIYVDL